MKKAPFSMSNAILVRSACEADLGAMLELYQQLSPAVPVADAALAPAIWREVLARPGITAFVADHDGLASATCTLVIVGLPRLELRWGAGRNWVHERRPCCPDF